MDDLAGAGPYLIHPRTSVIEPLLVAICTPLAYDLKHYRANASLVYQNKVSTGQYRGVGMPVASLVAEGLVDAAARATGLDKAEIRKRNLFRDDAYPVTGISGEYLECLSQQASLDKLLGMMDYDRLQRGTGLQDATRASTRASAWLPWWRARRQVPPCMPRAARRSVPGTPVPCAWKRTATSPAQRA